MLFLSFYEGPSMLRSAALECVDVDRIQSGFWQELVPSQTVAR